MTNNYLAGTEQYRYEDELKEFVANSDFDYEKKELLNLILYSKMTFISYSYDGMWDYTYSLTKSELTRILIKNEWTVDFGYTHMGTNIFMLLIDFNKVCSIETIFGKDAGLCSFNKKTFKIIEIYLTEYEILDALKRGLIKNTKDHKWDFFNDSIMEEVIG